MVAAQSARLRGFVGLARDSKQVSTLGSASTRCNRQANELPAEWSSDQRVFWRVLKPTRPLTGSSIRSHTRMEWVSLPLVHCQFPRAISRMRANRTAAFCNCSRTTNLFESRYSIVMVKLPPVGSQD
jgi:hypothetical protein